MQFRFDKIKKEDLKVVEGNLYIRTHNQWFLFVKDIKGFTFETEFGKCVFAVTDSKGFRHVFFTSFGVYASICNVEVVVGEYVNAEYLWTADTLAKNSDHAVKLFADIETTLSKMNSEVRELKSVNKYADLNDHLIGLPDTKEEETEEDEDEEYFGYRC